MNPPVFIVLSTAYPLTEPYCLIGDFCKRSNIILLFQPPACPEVNPTERVWEYLKGFLACSVFSNLDELRTKVQEILASFTARLIGFLTGWSWILHSLSLSHL